LLLYQEEDGFLFNSDSHYLYDFISKLNPKGEVLDVGSGCGILGLLVKRDFKISLTSIDIQENSTFLTKQNAKVNSLEVDAICGDFLDYDFQKRFDFIISNPPYYHDNVVKSENKKLKIARYTEFLELEKFIKKSKKLLNPRGNLIFCYDSKEIDTIFTLLKEAKLNPEHIRFVHSKIDRVSHLVFMHARLNSKSQTKILPPLIAMDGDDFTKEVKNIYKKTKTYSIKSNFSIK